MEQYIRINYSSIEKIEEIKQKLSELGVSFDVFNYATEVFFDEEAEYRLDMWEESNEEIHDESLRNSILDSLRDSFFNDESVIDGERLEDITSAVVGEYLSDND